ncbi:MAG TPA: LptA/OstA family protein [Opitutaceae bacterium]
MMLRRASACLLAAASLACGLRAAEKATSIPAAGAAATAPAAPLVDTVIESGSADMVSTATETTFTFRNGVTVTATNMKLTCDELVVVAKRSGDAAATIGKQDNFKSLIATGNVRLVQGDREAICGRAAVYPGEDKVELTENPVVRSLKEGWSQSGPKMVLYRGERRAVVEGTATERPRLTLPALKDLGDLGDLGKDAKKKKEAKQEPKQEAPTTAPATTPPPLVQPSAEETTPKVTVPGLTPPTK